MVYNHRCSICDKQLVVSDNYESPKYDDVCNECLEEILLSQEEWGEELFTPTEEESLEEYLDGLDEDVFTRCQLVSLDEVEKEECLRDEG